MYVTFSKCYKCSHYELSLSCRSVIKIIMKIHKKVCKIGPWGLYYKTFYGRNLRFS
jgi:hypothetical protein